ncbi:Uncharacterised protein [Xylophilus ampelinus]|nr:Uncharacterised protein [Xylophilus ampelinus]
MLLDAELEKALAQRRSDGTSGLWYGAAVVVALLLVLRFVWYVLLRRTAALRDTNAGRAPSA